MNSQIIVFNTMNILHRSPISGHYTCPQAKTCHFSRASGHWVCQILTPSACIQTLDQLSYFQDNCKTRFFPFNPSKSDQFPISPCKCTTYSNKQGKRMKGLIRNSVSQNCKTMLGKTQKNINMQNLWPWQRQAFQWIGLLAFKTLVKQCTCFWHN